jgi:antitoxin component HigA of HigAB toxin-antitoxin module
MIIYKLEDIKSKIAEMKNNIDGILDKGEAYLSSDIDKYRSRKQEIMSNDNYTESGKFEILNELSINHYDGIKKEGENFINDIANEYDRAIAEVSKLVKYDSEEKASQEDKVDKVKENTDLMYVIQALNSIEEEQETKLLKELFEKYQTNEKIMYLIKLKANKLSKNDVTSTNLDEVLSKIKLLDTDYVEQLQKEKNNRIDYYRESGYTCKTFAHKLNQIYEVSVGKSLLEFAQ